MEWRGGTAWELGGGKVRLDVEPGSRSNYASYAYEQDGSLIASSAITNDGETVPGFRRAMDGSWSPTEVRRKSIWRGPSRLEVRDVPDKRGGISLVFGVDAETAITTSDVPDRRSSATWTGERFLVGFPTRDGDGYAIYVSAVTCGA